MTDRHPWGHAGRHYSASMADASRVADRAAEQADIRWGKALERASPSISDTVQRTFKQWNTILRDYLRSETALRLTTGGDSQSVPVKVVGGMPRPFAEVLRQFEGLEWLLLNRRAVEAATSGTRFIEQYMDSAQEAWGDELGLQM